MVHSGYHPLQHRPLRIVLGWTLHIVGHCTVGYHGPLNCTLSSLLGWCTWMVGTVDIILLSIVHCWTLRIVLGYIVALYSGYHPLNTSVLLG